MYSFFYNIFHADVLGIVSEFINSVVKCNVLFAVIVIMLTQCPVTPAWSDMISVDLTGQWREDRSRGPQYYCN